MTGLFTVANLFAFNVQIVSIVAAAAMLLRLLPVASAGARYGAWRVAVLLALFLPWLLRSTPAPQIVPAAPVIELAVAGTAIDAAGADVPQLASPPAARPLPWTTLLLVVIGGGIVLRASWLAAGLWRLRALRACSAIVDDEVYIERQRMLDVHTEIGSVAGLRQPVTFGVCRPVVLVPESLAEAPEAQRLAVITHELLHVQRRDWGWLLVEELLRTVLWFQPAIWWATSRIQLAREELVDELTVLATGNRKAYIEALLAFADAETLRPATAFARRRFLFTRIVRLSKERVMSAPRIVVSTAAIVAAVVGAGWYTSSAFPIFAAAPVVAAPDQPRDAAFSPAAQKPDTQTATPRDTTPALTVNTQAQKVSAAELFARDLQERVRAANERAKSFMPPQGARNGGASRPGPAAVPATPQAIKPITPENPIPRRLSAPEIDYPPQFRGSGARGSVVVRVVLDGSGSVADVTRVSSNVTAGDSATMRSAIEAFLTAAVDGVKLWRYAPPADAPIAFFVQVAFAEGGAVTLQSDSPIVIPVNGGGSQSGAAGLATLQARLAALRAEQQSLALRLNDQHPDRLRNQQQIADVEAAIDRVKATLVNGGATKSTGPGFTTQTPVRIGGGVPPPTRTKNVAPEYPAIAQSSRVQGVVIVEVTIDEQGRIAEARILRSIPLLDQAALDAVKQWEYTPTLLNGVPVPVIMTVTVNFTLDPAPGQ